MNNLLNKFIRKLRRAKDIVFRKLLFNLFFIKYSRRLNDKRFPCRWRDRYIITGEATSTTAFDGTYVFHIAWAMRKVAGLKPLKHIDISSSLYFITNLSAFVPVDFYDFRPAKLNLSNLNSFSGDLMNLQFPDNSIKSLSCLHVIEHVGLGRYGDPYDAKGDMKSAKELERVLAPGGNLLIAVPTGKSRIQFNAHRIYEVEQVMELFKNLELVSFALVDDNNEFIENADWEYANIQKYGCGCFHFTKRKRV